MARDRSGRLDGATQPSLTASRPTSPLEPAADGASAIGAAQADAALWRAASAQGRIVAPLPLEAVDPDHLRRDRIQADEPQMAELKASILASGQRTPIEVVRLDAGGDRAPFGLISGWRRLRAMRALHRETADPRFATILARILPEVALSAAYAAMVDENEVRATLSHYERGRIAVVAAEDGVFPDVEAAVAALFMAGSKAKRSKIRSFALVHETLGDVLQHGCELSERAGLRIAAAIRSGAAGALRAALDIDRRRDPATEWRALEPVLAAAEYGLRPNMRRSRRTGFEPRAITLKDGTRVRLSRDGGAILLRIDGTDTVASLADQLLAEVLRVLETG